MQLNLDLFDPPDPPATAPAAWQRIDEAARVTAIEILARLITRMLQDELATEAGNE